MSILTEFPEMSRTDLRDLKKGVDEAFRTFTRANGESIENFFYPLLKTLAWFERVVVATPWPLMILILCGLVYAGSRSWFLVIGTTLTLLLIGYLGMWEDTMFTLALISVATLICIVIGIPLGILMSKSD
ncbi:MAG: proline/glycine betaine ABC transporter permease, partial [Rhodobacteraceae bacterium]|nr:proline/glycine betaine ABC transporter permease [Paracoccaceae bacterium]